MKLFSSKIMHHKFNRMLKACKKFKVNIKKIKAYKFLKTKSKHLKLVEIHCRIAIKRKRMKQMHKNMILTVIKKPIFHKN